MKNWRGAAIVAVMACVGAGFASTAQAQLGNFSKAPVAAGTQSIVVLAKTKTEKKPKCKAEPGCPCVNGRQVCH